MDMEIVKSSKYDTLGFCKEELKVIADGKYKSGYHAAAEDMLRILEKYSVPYGCVKEIIKLRNKVK